MNRLTSNLAWVIMSRGSPTVPSLFVIRLAVAPQCDSDIKGLCDFYYYLFFVFLFLATRTAQTREPIFTHNSLKDAF